MRIPGAPRDTNRAARDFDGGGTTQVVQSNQQPWSTQQPFLATGFNEAQNLYNRGPYQFYPNSTVVPFSGQTESALGGIEARARAGSPLLPQAQGELSKTLNGDYLSAGNPAFGAMMDRIRSEITPSIDAKFAGSGRYGSGAHSAALSSALADTGGQLAFQNYGDERNRMAQAMGLAPGLAQADYMDNAQLANVGAAREAKAGENLSDQIQRFNFEQSAPDEALRRFMTLVAGGQYGGQNVQTSSNNQGTGFGDVAGGLFSLAGSGLMLKKLLGG